MLAVRPQAGVHDCLSTELHLIRQMKPRHVIDCSKQARSGSSAAAESTNPHLSLNSNVPAVLTQDKPAQSSYSGRTRRLERIVKNNTVAETMERASCDQKLIHPIRLCHIARCTLLLSLCHGLAPHLLVLERRMQKG